MVARAGSTVRVLLVLIGVLAALGRPPVAAAQAPEPAATASAASVRETLDGFCVRCHNDRLRTADLALDTHDLAHVGADAEIMGTGHPQAPRADDAAGGQPAAGRGHVRRRRLLARDGHRQCGPRQPGPRPRRDVPPPEPGRVPRRRPRPAGGGRRRRRAAAGRRHLRARLRQQRRRALDLAGPGGAVPLGRAPHQPPRRRHSPHRPRRRDLPGAPRPRAGRPAARPPVVRVPGGHRDSALLPRRRRVHDPDPPPPELLRLHHRLRGAAGAGRARRRRPRRAVRRRRRRFGGADGPAQLLGEHRRGPRVGVLHEHGRRASRGALPGEGGSNAPWASPS